MKFHLPSSFSLSETPIWVRVVWIIAIANFASFWVIAVVNGGDALNGKKEAGKYFVCSHGRYTEVSESFFDYSRIHAESLWITHPVALLSVFWLTGKKKALPV